MASGTPGLQLFTLNRLPASLTILKNLGFAQPRTRLAWAVPRRELKVDQPMHLDNERAVGGCSPRHDDGTTY